MNCEECEDTAAEFQCTQCGQALCRPCDKKIHNKGNRVLHERKPVEDSVEVITSPKRKVDAHTIRHQQHQERFLSIMKQQSDEPHRSSKRLNIQAPSLVIEEAVLIPLECPIKETQGHRHIVEQFLRSKANNGDLMINLDELRNHLKNKEVKVASIKEVLQDIETSRLAHVTTRKFGDSDPIKFVSLLVAELSFECIIWILKAIRKDEMTPTDKLIQSRIKECLGMKLPTNEWNNFFQSLLKLQDSEGVITQTIRNKQVKIKVSKSFIESSSKIADVSQSQSSVTEGLYVLTLEDGIPFKMSDAIPLGQEHRPIWKSFISFLKDFFDSEVSSYQTENTDQLSDQAINISTSSSQRNQDFKWIRSVENGPQHSVSNSSINQSYLSQPNSKQKKKGSVKPPKSIQKAIPGGKYGCAQLLKCCGPLELRVCSLGLLCLLIQEAITRGILIYYKTLLIKPNQNVAFDFMDYVIILDEQTPQKTTTVDPELKITIEKQRQLQDQQEKVHKVRKVVTEILQDQQKGVSLARLPKMIQRRLTFQYDLHELGYTKLKQFLQSIPEVKIENDGTTYASVVLKTAEKTPRDLSPNSYNKKFSTLKQEHRNFHYQKNLSNVQDYQHRIDLTLKQILAQHPFGVPSQYLLQTLNQMLQSNFDPTLFGCSSFEDYLIKQADPFADVMMKARGCVVYPKGMQGWQAWTPQQQFAYQQQQQFNMQYMMQFYGHGQNPQQKKSVIGHSKSHSSTLSGYNQPQNTSGIVKAESFLAGMQQHPDPQSNSLTFQSVNTTPINKEFFMIQEEESHLELDENLKFIEELLKESDDQHHQQRQKPQKPQTQMSLGTWPWSPQNNKFSFHSKANTGGPLQGSSPNNHPSPHFPVHSQIGSLHSWDFDNQKDAQ